MATEHPQLISYVSPAREIKPFEKDAHPVKGRLATQAQVNSKYLICRRGRFKLCLTEKEQLFLNLLNI